MVRPAEAGTNPDQPAAAPPEQPNIAMNRAGINGPITARTRSVKIAETSGFTVTGHSLLTTIGGLLNQDRRCVSSNTRMQV
jgi:hypothetical protein